MCVLMMTGCKSSTVPLQRIELPPDLAQPCPDLPQLADGRGETVLKWAAQAVRLYRDCQARHGAVVGAVGE